MSGPTSGQIETYVDSAAALLGLPLAPEHRAGVLGFFALAAGMAAVIEATPLGPHDDSPMRFEPVSPKAPA